MTHISSCVACPQLFPIFAHFWEKGISTSHHINIDWKNHTIVIKAIINHPPVITINRWYKHHSKMGGLWHCFHHTTFVASTLLAVDWGEQRQADWPGFPPDGLDPGCSLKPIHGSMGYSKKHVIILLRWCIHGNFAVFGYTLSTET